MGNCGCFGFAAASKPLLSPEQQAAENANLKSAAHAADLAQIEAALDVVAELKGQRAGAEKMTRAEPPRFIETNFSNYAAYEAWLGAGADPAALPTPHKPVMDGTHNFRLSHSR